MVINHIADLGFELERDTCTCRKRSSWDNNWMYSTLWNRPIHGTCNKPSQDQVVYQCCWCEEYFISKTLRPAAPQFKLLYSVLYIARALTPPRFQNKEFPFKPSYDKIGEVYCDGCSEYAPGIDQ